MASSVHTKRIEIPNRLWEKLNAVAAKTNTPTSQLAGMWLYEELQRRSRIPGDPADGLALNDSPYKYDVTPYTRRQRVEG